VEVSGKKGSVLRRRKAGRITSGQAKTPFTGGLKNEVLQIETLQLEEAVKVERFGVASDEDCVREKRVFNQIRPVVHFPWALELRAVCAEEPCRLIQRLTGAIVGCGGWVLSRGASDSGMVTLLFEFERQACVEIYSILLAAGLELNHQAHLRFTELLQCTSLRLDECREEIASIDLEIVTMRTQTEEEPRYREVA
jgi:hypothetical protein